MLTIVNYELGNHISIMKLLNKIGIENTLTADHKEIQKADKLILPGVGNFGAAMKRIKSKGLFNLLNEKVLGEKTPILGICLGMQLMTKSSEESDEEGFGWFDANCYKFKDLGKLKVPHVGWNTFELKRENVHFKQGLKEKEFFYFTHSYYAKANNKAHILGETKYGHEFASILCNNNILGTQFHPEKSYDAGFQLLKSFGEGTHVS